MTQWPTSFIIIKCKLKDDQLSSVRLVQVKKLDKVREFGMDIYALLYLKWITNKDLLYSTWNSAQCHIAAWMGGKFGEERYMCIMAESLHCSPETITTLFVNWLHPNIQNKKLVFKYAWCSTVYRIFSTNVISQPALYFHVTRISRQGEPPFSQSTHVGITSMLIKLWFQPWFWHKFNPS